MSSDSAYLNLPVRSYAQAAADAERDAEMLEQWKIRNGTREWAHGCNALARALFPDMKTGETP